MITFIPGRMLLDLVGLSGRKHLAETRQKIRLRWRAHKFIRANKRMQFPALHFHFGRFWHF